MTVKLDLRVHLKDRGGLLRSLILFINDNKAAGLVRPSVNRLHSSKLSLSSEAFGIGKGQSFDGR